MSKNPVTDKWHLIFEQMNQLHSCHTEHYAKVEAVIDLLDKHLGTQWRSPEMCRTENEWYIALSIIDSLLSRIPDELKQVIVDDEYKDD